MAYRCRAYPDQAQQQMLNRTFGCVRVVWNRTLAARQARWHLERTGTSYAETDRALTAMKKDPDLAFLSEVSSVPLQQALRHQHQAFTAFFARRARYPRFKSRRGRQAAHYTRSAFTMRGGVLRLAKTAAPLRLTWSWPEVDLTALDPTMVIISREPDGRWYVTFTLDTDAPEPRPDGPRPAGGQGERIGGEDPGSDRDERERHRERLEVAQRADELLAVAEPLQFLVLRDAARGDLIHIVAPELVRGAQDGAAGGGESPGGLGAGF